MMTKTEEPKEPTKPTCFVIMPISDTGEYESGHFGRVYDYILKPAIQQAGYRPIRADDTTKTDYIVVGIVKNILDADIVLCDLSSKNPNVMYELGIRHSFSKPVALIKDSKTEKIFDIQGLRYTEYDSRMRIDDVQRDIEKVKQSILDTASLKAEEINSVIQLAGIKPAELPPAQKVSPETTLILNTISALEKRLDSFSNRDSYNRGTDNNNWHKIFRNSYNTKPNLDTFIYGDNNIYNSSGVFETGENGEDKFLGQLIELTESKVSIRKEDNTILEIKPSSPRYKNLIFKAGIF